MKKLIINSLFFFILIFAFIIYLNGCSNNSVNPTTTNSNININGKLIDFNNNGVSGATVVINGITATSGNDGSFTINNIKTPYDLKIIATGGTKGLVYKGLTTANPIAYTIGVTTTPSSASLIVNLPNGYLNATQRAYVIYTDTISIQQSNMITGPGNSTTLNVVWPGTSPISGRVLVLIANINNTGNITGYSGYAQKNSFTLNNGSSTTLNLTGNDFTITPGPATVSGNIVPPSGYINTQSTINISFCAGSALNPGVTLDNSGQSFNFTTPTNLTTAFKLYVRGNSTGVLPENTTKIMQVNSPSSGNSLTLDPVPALSTPANLATGIDTNSIFSYSSVSGTGIYLLTANSNAPPKSFYIITSDISTTIPNLAAYGLTLGSSVTYQWTVQRILGISTTDNFVSSLFLNNTQFNGITSSSIRTFTSAP